MVIIISIFPCINLPAQQVADSAFNPPIEGWSQRAYIKSGGGRMVMFGEAAMFTAQLAGPAKTRVGMNSDYAEENYRLLLNIIHWLDGKYE